MDHQWNRFILKRNKRAVRDGRTGGSWGENAELQGREVHTYRPGSEEEKQVSRTDTLERIDGAQAAGV